MSPAENREDVVGAEKQAQRRRNGDENGSRDQSQRCLERRQRGIQQRNVTDILMIGAGSDAVIVMMRFAIMMMAVRVLVGDLRRTDVPGLILVKVSAA